MQPRGIQRSIRYLSLYHTRWAKSRQSGPHCSLQDYSQAVKQPAGLDPGVITQKKQKALGVLKWAPKAPKNSVYKVMTITNDDVSINQ